MPIEITMPQLSDTMTRGVLVKWLAKEGDAVKVGDVITVEMTPNDGTTHRFWTDKLKTFGRYVKLTVVSASGIFSECLEIMC